MHPEIDVMPTKDYIDGGFTPVSPGNSESDLIISKLDAQILAKYLVDLKNWGSEGWIWITDFYIAELERLKENLPTE